MECTIPLRLVLSTIKGKVMKIDYEYVKEILDVFLNSDTPTIDCDSFLVLRKGDDSKLIFHLKLLQDKNLIVGAIESGEMGITLRMNNIYYFSSILPWRLTADGHDFAYAITKPSILNVVQEKFKSGGLSVVIDVVKKIVEKQAEKLIGD
jgi:hypothetical protein